MADPVLNCPTSVITDSDYLVNWTHDNPTNLNGDPTTQYNYEIRVNGNAPGTSEVYPSTQWTSENIQQLLSSNSGIATIELYAWPDEITPDPISDYLVDSCEIRYTFEQIPAGNFMDCPTDEQSLPINIPIDESNLPDNVIPDSIKYDVVRGGGSASSAGYVNENPDGGVNTIEIIRSYSVNQEPSSSGIILLCPSDTVTSPGPFTFHWEDPSPPPLRRYDLFINDIDTSNSVLQPATSQTTDLPLSAYGVTGTQGTFTITLKSFDTGDFNDAEDVGSCEVSYDFSQSGNQGSGLDGQDDSRNGQLRTIFDNALNAHVGRDYTAITCVSPDDGLMSSTTGYFNYEGFDGLCKMYDVYGDTNYIDHAYTMANLYIDAGSDRDGDGFHDWWSCTRNAYLDHHFEWRAAAGIGLLLCKLIDTPALGSYDQNKLAVFLRDHVWSKWGSQNTPTGQHYYSMSNGTHMLARMIPVAISLDKFYGGTAPQTPGNSYADFLSAPGSTTRNLEDHILHPANQNGTACNIWGRTIPVPGADVSGTLSPGTNLSLIHI